jgi:hypothetical protein
MNAILESRQNWPPNGQAPSVGTAENHNGSEKTQPAQSLVTTKNCPSQGGAAIGTGREYYRHCKDINCCGRLFQKYWNNQGIKYENSSAVKVW